MRAARARRTSGSRCGPARRAPTCCWSPRSRDGAALDRRRPSDGGAPGIDKLNVAALDDPGGHARRLLAPACRRWTRAARPLPPAADARSTRQTGCPVLVNTSFNVRGEPIVCTPRGRLPLLHGDGHRRAVRSDGRRLRRASSRRGVDLTRRRARIRVPTRRLVSPCCRGALRARRRSRALRAVRHRLSGDGRHPAAVLAARGPATRGDVTEHVKAFYEETPFPNYDEHDSVRSLIEKSRRGIYARTARRRDPLQQHASSRSAAAPASSRTFSASRCRSVVGADLCLNSLRLGEAFRRTHELVARAFVADEPVPAAVPRRAFDVVLCNGVLHHTSDPRRVPVARAGSSARRPHHHRALQHLRPRRDRSPPRASSA